MNPHLIAKIKAPDQQAKNSIGTGYPITQEWVITAKHVIDFVDRSNEPIIIEWLNHHPVKVQDIKLLDNDIALLRCNVPAELGRIDFSPAAKLPAEREGWKSAGHPDVNDCELFDATGQFGVDLGHAMITLTLDDTCRLDQWGGMSGAPVFKGDRFCAVIIEHDQRMEKRLNAISIPWLLQNNQNFREAVGLDENALMCQRFLEKQREQIKQHLVLMESGSFFEILASKLLVQELKSCHLTERLFAEFDANALDLLDTVLKASIEAIKQDGDKFASQIQKLFFLLVSLMTPYSTVARNTIMSLPVRTRMATELQLAQSFDANPTFELGLDGYPKGCFAEDASVFVREVGWDVNRQADEATKVIYKHVYKRDREQLLDEFEREELNETIRQRQNREHGKIHRIELNEGDPAMQNNPLANPDFCAVLKSADYLPNFPIVHYGKATAPNEAKLRAKLRELFEILKPYGYTP